MKNFIKWKILIITCLACLLPVLIGVALWDKLPREIAVHFNMNNVPDRYARKSFAVFGIPALMVLLQIICCVINDVNAKKFGDRKKFERATKSIIPIMTFLLQSLTFAYALDIPLDIRKCAIAVVGMVFLVIGNYLPKFDYIKNHDVQKDKARKINRFIGIMSVVMGVLAIITVFLPPVISLIWLFMLIPYGIVASVYTAKEIKKK